MRLHWTFAALTRSRCRCRPVPELTTIARNDSAPPRITIDSTSPEWTRRIEWGLDRFRDAGLPLPAMAITVHDDDAACDGNSGRYLPNDPVEVHLCTQGPADSRVGEIDDPARTGARVGRGPVERGRTGGIPRAPRTRRVERSATSASRAGLRARRRSGVLGSHGRNDPDHPDLQRRASRPVRSRSTCSSKDRRCGAVSS